MKHVSWALVILLGVGAMGFLLAQPVSAKSRGEELRENIRERIAEQTGTRGGFLRDFLKLGRAAIGSCTLASKSGTTLTCTKDSKTYTILTDSKTQLRRRFWGKATLDEMQIGDTLNVVGKWTDDARTTIQARLVRDISIQKRFGVFFGTVKSLTADGWVMDTVSRGSQTVTVTGSTKIVNRRGETITKGDVAVGHRVRVKGLWDRTNNTVTEVNHVKDYSLPPRPTGTPTP